MKKNVGILIFDNAEVMDFAGPFEVFGVTSDSEDNKLFNVFTVAKTSDPISSVNELSINPNYGFQDVPKIDILIISGGEGSKQAMDDQDIIDWIKKTHESTEFTLSICSGSRFLGKIGLLNGQPYCTHHMVYEHMEELVPTGLPQKDKRFTCFGKVYTSAGISAGIDLSFHIVGKIHGKDVSMKTGEYMEYRIGEEVLDQ